MEKPHFLKWRPTLRLVKSGLTNWDEASGAYDRRYWRQVPPWLRTDWGRFLRIKRGDREVKEVLAELAGHLSPAPSPGNYSSWENRGPVPSQWQTAFRQMYGGGPETVPQAVRPKPQQDAATSSDMAALVVALREQADASRLLAASVAQLAEAVATRPPVSLAAADGMTTTVLEAIENVRGIPAITRARSRRYSSSGDKAMMGSVSGAAGAGSTRCVLRCATGASGGQVRIERTFDAA